jgi:hypothetical protein
MEELKIGTLCLLKKTGEQYYFIGKRKVRENGENHYIFKKYNRTGFLTGFCFYKKLSEFDETNKTLNQITINHFENELNNHPLFHK